MKTLSDYQQKIDEYCVFEEDVKKHMGSEYSGINSDWNKLFQEINYLEGLHEKNFDFGNLDSMSNYEFEQSQKYFESIFDIWEKHSNIIADNIEYISKCFDKKIFDTENEIISKAITKFENCLNNYEKLDSWFYFKDLISQLTEKGILNILDYLLKNNVEPAQIINAFKKGVFKLWIESIISKSPVLSQFNRVNQDQIIKTFSEKDKLNFELNIAKIQSKLSKNRPSLDFVSPGSAVSILQREEKKKRNVKSVRDLMSTIGELIQVLKPCFLMSPMSVSTFLKNINFDVVIFDEASQIFPQDAIGSIYRGKQLIVVGDSKQMPPSNFFNTTIESEYSSENGEDDITDFESILDVCASSFPEISLKWHYRSKSEELIAFSNKNFYRNSLITFPSVKSNTKWLGIDYHYINGGTFDHKTRSNLKEANYIVDLIYENIEKFPKRSLGVVAFSVSQQELIEELLFKRRRQEPEKESFFSQSKKEPFFIKNLETVQGDERDTIIFSIAYAKDADGRLLHNFGPINRQGGERRLNVATTRAKFNIQVVTSIHGYDIDLKRTASEGARLLREYIDFAENGIKALNSQLNVKSDEHFDSTFEMEVYDFLKSKGFNVDTQVGCSGFKIDLALKSDNNSEYILAIECDGATYHSSKNARDRDRLRQEILENMGWKFYRIWSTDWFKNTSVEKERLLNVVRLALQNHDFQGKYSGTEEQKADSKWLQPCRDNPTFEFSKYKTADIDKLHIENPINFKKFVRLVLEVESPLSEEWFLRRISKFFGREKVTKAVKNEYKKKMHKCSEYGILRKNDFLYLENKNIDFRIQGQGDNSRDFYFISPEELSVGMLKIIEKSISISKEELYRSIINLQDTYKLTAAIRKRLDEAFSLITNKLNYSPDNKLTINSNTNA